MHHRPLVTAILSLMPTTVARALSPGAAKRHEDIFKRRPMRLLPEHRPVLDLGTQPLIITNPMIPPLNRLRALAQKVLPDRPKMLAPLETCLMEPFDERPVQPPPKLILIPKMLRRHGPSPARQLLSNVLIKPKAKRIA